MQVNCLFTNIEYIENLDHYCAALARYSWYNKIKQMQNTVLYCIFFTGKLAVTLIEDSRGGKELGWKVRQWRGLSNVPVTS